MATIHYIKSILRILEIKNCISCKSLPSLPTAFLLITFHGNEASFRRFRGINILVTINGFPEVVKLPGLHATSWVETSVQCRYLPNFPVHVLKFFFCPSILPLLYLITPIAQTFIQEMKFPAFIFDLQINIALLIYSFPILSNTFLHFVVHDLI